MKPALACLLLLLPFCALASDDDHRDDEHGPSQSLVPEASTIGATGIMALAVGLILFRTRTRK